MEKQQGSYSQPTQPENQQPHYPLPNKLIPTERPQPQSPNEPIRNSVSSSSQKQAQIGDPEELQKNAQMLEPLPQQIYSEPIQKVFQSAYHQRKYLNQTEFNQYAKKRNLYFQKHVMALENIVYQLNAKIKETTTFIPLLIKHFHQVSNSHKAFIESCKKIDVFKYLTQQKPKQKKEAKHQWFPGIMQGIKLLMNLKDDTSARHKTMDQHVVSEVIPGLERCLENYTKSLNVSLKAIEKQKDKYKDVQAATQKKLQKADKMFENHSIKKDWLSYELAIFQLMERSRQDLISFGNLTHTYWKQIINHEKELAQAVQKVVQQLLQNYRQVNTISKQFETYVSFWKSLNVDMDVDTKFIVSNVLPLNSLDFLKTTLKVKQILKEQYSLDDFDTFNKIQVEKQMFGNRQQILSSLIVKRFVAQRQGQQNTHQHIIVYSTVDHYLVFYDEENVDKTNKMQIKRLLNTRKSDYAVNVNQKIEGFIMDSWNREVIYFSSSDQAEQFMFHTQNNDQLKKSYIQ